MAERRRLVEGVAVTERERPVEGVTMTDPLGDPGVYAALLPMTEAMRRAYRRALRDYIESLPLAERVSRWGRARRGRGYNVSDDVKARVRWESMLRAAFTKSATDAYHDRLTQLTNGKDTQ